MEELNCRVEALEVFHDNNHKYENVIVNLICMYVCMKCNIIEGVPTSNEHFELIWFKRENLESLKWASDDIPTVNQLINE